MWNHVRESRKGNWLDGANTQQKPLFSGFCCNRHGGLYSYPDERIGSNALSVLGWKNFSVDRIFWNFNDYVYMAIDFLFLVVYVDSCALHHFDGFVDGVEEDAHVFDDDGFGGFGPVAFIA